MSIIVINKKYGQPSDVDKIVYIGRPSVLGNPFVITQRATRAQVCEQYAEHLRAQYRTSTAVRNELHTLAVMHNEGKRIALQCWCAPLQCHGDFIKSAVEAIAAKV